MADRTMCLLVVALVGCVPSAAGAQEHQHPGAPPSKLGVVHFENSCGKGVQESIGQAMAMLHSFWYEEAHRLFAEVAAAEPSCITAWWGVAMTQWQPLWEVRGPSRAALERGRAAIAGGEAARGGTVRERDYLAAVGRFFKDAETVDHLARVRAYEDAMSALRARYPKDPEASVLYAFALLASAAAHPPDKTYARQKKAGELLEAAFRTQPDHPGVAHYIIHAYDYPALAGGAVDAARRYATVAPDAPHALHMPSHIFVRRGLWPETIESNRQVAAAARRHGIPGEELHGRDYWVFAHLQRGEDDLAREVIDAKLPLSQVPPDSTSYFAGLFATAAMPARYVVERRQWAEAAQLPVPAGLPGGRYAWADAVVYFARALGAARSGRVDQARQEIDKIAAAHRTLVDNREDYWARQVEMQRMAAEAWVLFSQEQHDRALALARAAADIESSTDKHPVTPGNIVPSRDLLAQMLLEVNRPADALIEFQQVLRAEPNRFGALYGAARAAEMTGDASKAREFYATLVTVAPDSRRSEVQRAREVLAGR